MDEKEGVEIKKETGSTGKKKRKRTAASFMIEFFIKIGVTAIVVAVLLLFVAGIYVKHDNSSYPMIKDGDLCITYKLGRLREGDVIVYKYNDKVCFGRIVAIAGDTVDVSDSTITVNGYGVYDNTVYPTTAEGSSISFPYVVPADSYFVLNDYRDDINDSRIYGAIKKEDTNGKVVFLLRRRGI